MREDMAQVIVERPRRMFGAPRKGRERTFDQMPAREGMRRPHLLNGNPKEFNEYLAPLRRYLEGQVGRPWDKIYSEIAKRLRVDNAVQQHVREQLHDFVAIHAVMDFAGERRWRQDLYVDPTTGLLCRTDRLPQEKVRLRARHNRQARPVERVPLAIDRDLRLIEGIWYEVRLADLPEPVYRTVREAVIFPRNRYSSGHGVDEREVALRRLITPSVRDVVTNRWVPVGPQIDDTSSWNTYRREQPDRTYAIAKRTLSRRELRRHGLRNDAPSSD
jgi:hypothetical protein